MHYRSLRSSMLARMYIAACSNLLQQRGMVEVWDVDTVPPENVAQLGRPKCTEVIRMVAFSPDNRQLLVCCDDSSIWRWDVA